MGTQKVCDCGRKILVRRRGDNRMAVPADCEHTLCQRCWKAEQDRMRYRRDTKEKD